MSNRRSSKSHTHGKHRRKRSSTEGSSSDRRHRERSTHEHSRHPIDSSIEESSFSTTIDRSYHGRPRKHSKNIDYETNTRTTKDSSGHERSRRRSQDEASPSPTRESSYISRSRRRSKDYKTPRDLKQNEQPPMFFKDNDNNEVRDRVQGGRSHRDSVESKYSSTIEKVNIQRPRRSSKDAKEYRNDQYVYNMQTMNSNPPVNPRRDSNPPHKIALHVPVPPLPEELNVVSHGPHLQRIQPLETNYPGHHHQRWYFFWPEKKAPAKVSTRDESIQQHDDLQMESCMIQTSEFLMSPPVPPPISSPKDMESCKVQTSKFLLPSHSKQSSKQMGSCMIQTSESIPLNPSSTQPALPINGLKPTMKTGVMQTSSSTSENEDDTQLSPSTIAPRPKYAIGGRRMSPTSRTTHDTSTSFYTTSSMALESKSYPDPSRYSTNTPTTYAQTSESKSYQYDPPSNSAYTTTTLGNRHGQTFKSKLYQYDPSSDSAYTTTTLYAQTPESKSSQYDPSKNSIYTPTVGNRHAQTPESKLHQYDSSDLSVYTPTLDNRHPLTPVPKSYQNDLPSNSGYTPTHNRHARTSELLSATEMSNIPTSHHSMAYEQHEEKQKSSSESRESVVSLKSEPNACQRCGHGRYMLKTTTSGYITMLLCFPVGMYAYLTKRCFAVESCSYCGSIKPGIKKKQTEKKSSNDKI